jgi:deoxyribonuclease IV
MEKELLIGAHMSISKGYSSALIEGQKIGANIVQIFTANQRQWTSKKILQDEIQSWEETKKECSIQKVMSHGSYLINLGSSEKELRQKSQKAFQEELERCHLLNIDYLIFHPGAAVSKTEDECLDTICESLLKITNKGSTKILLETTAGQGTNVGYKFEHLAYILKKVKSKLSLGVCFDTCHCFAAGYDLRTPMGWDKTLKEFDEIIGIDHLEVFHVNDSVHDLNSRKDRHAQIGEGKIGIDSFKYLMENPKTKYLPKILETPDHTCWKDEVKMLKKFAGEN